MKQYRKIIIFFTFLILSLSTAAHAADPWMPWDLSSLDSQVIDQGTCGSNLNWKLTTSGYLIITGSGPMNDFYTYEPWEDNYSLIKNVYIGLGVTSIGQGAFYDTFLQGSIQNLYISPTVKLIDNAAFHNCVGLKTIVFTGPMPELVFPFGGVTGTVYYPDTWTEVPNPGDYGMDCQWVRYPFSSLPDEFRRVVVEAPTPEKQPQALRVSALSPSVKATAVKKKAQTISRGKAFNIKGAVGTVTFTKKGGSKYLSISKNGVITVKKGTPKGTKTINVTVKSAGNDEYKAAQKTVTVSVKIK